MKKFEKYKFTANEIVTLITAIGALSLGLPIKFSILFVSILSFYFFIQKIKNKKYVNIDDSRFNKIIWKQQDFMDKIAKKLQSKQNTPIIIVGDYGVGKTTFIENLSSKCQYDVNIINYYLENNLRNKIKEIGTKKENILVVFDQFERFINRHINIDNPNKDIIEKVKMYIEALINNNCKCLIMIRKNGITTLGC